MEYSNSSAGVYGSNVKVTVNNPVRDRDPNCIEMHLKNIEAELAESLNSAENLADKLAYATKAQGQIGSDPANQPPTPSNVQGRLEWIVNTVRFLNQQLGRAHSAISG